MWSDFSYHQSNSTMWSDFSYELKGERKRFSTCTSTKQKLTEVYEHNWSAYHISTSVQDENPFKSLQMEEDDYWKQNDKGHCPLLSSTDVLRSRSQLEHEHFRNLQKNWMNRLIKTWTGKGLLEIEACLLTQTSSKISKNKLQKHTQLSHYQIDCVFMGVKRLE